MCASTAKWGCNIDESCLQFDGPRTLSSHIYWVRICVEPWKASCSHFALTRKHCQRTRFESSFVVFVFFFSFRSNYKKVNSSLRCHCSSTMWMEWENIRKILKTADNHPKTANRSLHAERVHKPALSSRHHLFANYSKHINIALAFRWMLLAVLSTSRKMNKQYINLFKNK